MPFMNFGGMIITSHDLGKLSKKIFVCTSRGEGIFLQEIIGMAVGAERVRLRHRIVRKIIYSV